MSWTRISLLFYFVPSDGHIVALVDQVKGYINEMAMRLEDEDERISNLVKLFFHELSKKGNN